MVDYHRLPVFKVRATPKTIEDFSFLPGATQVERFERVVALGLRIAESGATPALPAPRITPPVSDDLAVAAPTPLTESEVIALVCTWPRKRLERLVVAVSNYAISQGWELA